MCLNFVVVIALFFALFGIVPFPSAADEPSYEGSNTIREGSPFTITCRVSTFSAIKWKKDNETLEFNNHYKINVNETDDNMRISTVTVNSAILKDSGSYRCTTEYNKFHVLEVVSTEADVIIKASYDFSDRHIAANYKQPLTINCTVEGTQDPKHFWKWLKDDKPITTEMSDSDSSLTVDGNNVIFRKFVEKHTGQYTCQLFNSNNGPSIGSKVIHVVLNPFYQLIDTITFIEEERAELECEVHGVPLPDINWRFGNNTIVPSQHYTFAPNDRNISNAILILNGVSENDKGYYYCGGKSSLVAIPISSKGCLVRVRGKFAALWPFLGICAEVIILCLVIFIYEKKRNKSEFEESDTDQGPEM
ncbi:basigin isoform X2 [Daktulosphaira vitifoliae]|uniref:basigin isoform X2 n=1 Tax=Daktulosphaira vitifoliae TaxID=58002 RepID=UPI0021AA0CC2|nr:basigin isoform X2 [Daktulosphaira vitifoliae]